MGKKDKVRQNKNRNEAGKTTALTGFDNQARQLVLLLFGVALFFTPYFRGLFFDREFFYFQIIFGLLFIGGLWAISRGTKDFKLLNGPLDLFVFLFIVVYFLAAISPASLRDAVGMVLRVATYFFVYWICANMLRSRKEFHFIFGVLIVTGVGVSLAGISTALGTFDFHGAWVGNRINSTLQYPNTLAAYLMALNLLALTLWSYYRNFLPKLLIGVANYIFILTIIGTNSRGAFLIYPASWLLLWLFLPGRFRWETIFNTALSVAVALVVSTKLLPAAIAGEGQLGWLWLGAGVMMMGLVQVAFMGIAHLFSKVHEKFGNKKIIAAVISLFLLVGAVGGVIAVKDKVTSVEEAMAKVVPATLMARLQTIDAEQTSVTQRLTYYEDALKIVKDNPLLGTGGGGWNATYRVYQGYPYSSTEVHSHFFQVWVETGTIGFIIFISIWFILILSGILAYRRSKDTGQKAVTWSLVAGALALGIHSAIDFNLSLGAVAILLWALFGLSQGWGRVEDLESTNQVPDKGEDFLTKIWHKADEKADKALPGVKTGAAMAGIVIILVASLALSQGAGSKAVAALEAGDLAQAGEHFEKGSKLDFFNANYLMDLAQVRYFQGQTNQSEDQLLEAIKLGKKAIKRKPYSHQLRFVQARILADMGEIELSVKETEIGASLIPKRREAYENLAEAYLSAAKHYLKNNEPQLAVKHFDQLLIVPELMALEWENTSEEDKKSWRGQKLDGLSGELHLTLGQGHVLFGDDEQAGEHLQEAVKVSDLAATAMAWQVLLAEKQDNVALMEELLNAIHKLDQNAIIHYVEWQDYI